MSRIYTKVVAKCGSCPHIKARMSGLAVNKWVCLAVDPPLEVYLLEIPKWCPLDEKEEVI